ncbi:hypothetical protein [Algoriphagus sp. Y33]|uniref:hypothetical protein n=1 Tax=Algoriphagus sp. Y33 TaxID=2772483 RepID=UPI00177F9B92|nr:hypothetical protein [Algoriphagus sp. Y33]
MHSVRQFALIPLLLLFSSLAIARQSVTLEEFSSENGAEVIDKNGEVQVSWPSGKWIRLEVWDIAANGVFTQPVWVE